MFADLNTVWVRSINIFCGLVIYGDDGDDELYGELGSDFLYAGNGSDILIGDIGRSLMNVK